MTEQILTQAELKLRLHYCPHTGIFTWVSPASNSVKVGQIANYKSVGYIRIMVNGIRYLAHRLAFLYMTGSFPPEHVDHINHDRSDNRWENLRRANRKTNGKNRGLSKNNTSGKTGVCFYAANKKKWQAQIKINGKVIYLGTFSTFNEAVKSREQAEIKYGFHPNHGRAA